MKDEDRGRYGEMGGQVGRRDVLARDFLDRNMGARATPRHELALTDAAPVYHVLGSSAGARAAAGLKRGLESERLGKGRPGGGTAVARAVDLESYGCFCGERAAWRCQSA